MEQLSWGVLLAGYLFVGGMAGGAFLVGALIDFFGKGKYKVISKSGVYLSLVSIILGLVLLIMDLGRFDVDPLSPLNAYVNFPTSIMSVGTWIITAFIVVSLFTSILWFFRGNSLIRKLFEIVGAALGVSTAAYTGILLSFSRGRPFWASPFLPSLFVVSGILTGLAMALFFIPIIAVLMPRFFEEFKELVDNRIEFAQTLIRSQRYLAIVIIVELILVGIELFLGHGAAMLSGSLSVPFFGYLILGLIVPLVVAFYSSRIERVGKFGLLFSVNLTGFTLILIGGFLLRYVILTAGQVIA